MLVEELKPRFCWSGLPRMLMKTVADLRFAGHVHVVDRDQAGFADVKFAADGLADSRFKSSRTRWKSKGCHVCLKS